MSLLTGITRIGFVSSFSFIFFFIVLLVSVDAIDSKNASLSQFGDANISRTSITGDAEIQMNPTDMNYPFRNYLEIKKF